MRSASAGSSGALMRMKKVWPFSNTNVGVPKTPLGAADSKSVAMFARCAGSAASARKRSRSRPTSFAAASISSGSRKLRRAVWRFSSSA